MVPLLVGRFVFTNNEKAVSQTVDFEFLFRFFSAVVTHQLLGLTDWVPRFERPCGLLEALC